MEIRLNKFISDSGYCSRREADKLIEGKKVIINKRVATIGDKVHMGDVIKVNGNLIESRNEYVYIALNKPVGITCTTDTTDSTNVIDLVNYPTRIFHIGRLDKDSEGLILLTDDGDIVNKILRSGNSHEKEYEVAVNKSITDDFIKNMQNGVNILGETTKKCKVEKEGDKNFRITLIQGLNRQIRRMCEVLGYEVVKLKRVRIMNITLQKLPLEQWRFLETAEVAEIFESIKESSNEKTRPKTTTNSKRNKPSESKNKTFGFKGKPSESRSNSPHGNKKKPSDYRSKPSGNSKSSSKRRGTR